MSNENSPLACNFTAIDRKERKKHKHNAREVFTSVEEWKELVDGYAFRIPADTHMVEKVGAFIARERLCCPFFKFTLEVTPDNGPVWLKLTGTDDVKEFIKLNVIPQLGVRESDKSERPNTSVE